MDFPFFVGYPPDPPDTNTKIKSPPSHFIFSLSLSHYFLPPPSFPASVALPLPSLPASIAPSLHHGATSSRVTTSRHHFLPPSLSAFSLSFIVTKLQWCSLSLGVCLGRSHRHGVVLDRGETSPDLVRSRQI
jgi:hypothetical protein